MALAAGDRLGPYEILAPLGAGVSGEVYRARDTLRQSEVAVEVSSAPFPEDFRVPPAPQRSSIIRTFARSTTLDRTIWRWNRSKASR